MQLGTWVGAVVWAFVTQPPELWWGAPYGQYTWVARFVVIVISGLAVIAAWRWRGQTHLRGWVAAVIIGALLGLILLFFYNALYDAWTCPLPGGSYTVIGAEYLPDAADAIRQTAKTHASCTDIVESATGLTYQVWPSDQILRRYFQLVALFIASTAFIAVAVIALLQALRCAGFSR